MTASVSLRRKSSSAPSRASIALACRFLSGSHVALTEEVLANMRAAGLERVPLIVGGIIPPADAERLRAAGVAGVYTPKDFEINEVLGAIVAEVERRLDRDASVAQR